MAPLRAKIIISFILLIVLLMLPDEATSQRRRRGMIASNTAQTDSLNRKDSLGADTVVVRVDSVAPTKKQPLDAPVIYESNDSTTFTLGGAATLYGSGKVNYQNIELAAEVISMNLDSSTVHAYGIKDTTGTIKGKPVFKEGETAYDTETISYNFKSKKAGITDIITQQGEGYVTGSRAKKGANDEIFMEHGRYTTCDHHDHPHFYMQYLPILWWKMFPCRWLCRFSSSLSPAAILRVSLCRRIWMIQAVVSVWRKADITLL